MINENQEYLIKIFSETADLLWERGDREGYTKLRQSFQSNHPEAFDAYLEKYSEPAGFSLFNFADIVTEETVDNWINSLKVKYGAIPTEETNIEASI